MRKVPKPFPRNRVGLWSTAMGRPVSILGLILLKTTQKRPFLIHVNIYRSVLKSCVLDRLIWYFESGGMHAISRRQREMEEAGVSFLGLRPSAMKMEKTRQKEFGIPDHAYTSRP